MRIPMSALPSPPPGSPFTGMESQNMNQRKIPAYVGAVFLYQGPRAARGTGFAEAMKSGKFSAMDPPLGKGVEDRSKKILSSNGADYSHGGKKL
jgi:hypothetical protein